MSTRPSGTSEPKATDRPSQYVMRKLPHITALFWVLKIIAVTIGETGSDEVATGLKLGYMGSAVAFLGFFLVMVVLQIRAKKFHPGIYWAVIMATSVVGTATSDLMDRGIGSTGKVTSSGIGYGPGALILTGMLAVVFVAWWRSGQTYDVENIATRKGETLYWLAILISNTLGTASGDWLSDTGLGFRNAFFIISGIMLALLAAHYLTNFNGVVLFWAAFVLTRPLSAVAGDSLTKDVKEGGLGLGPLWGTLVLLAVLAGLIAFQTYRLRRTSQGLLPIPVHRETGRPQEPNGEIVTAYKARTDHIVATA